MKITWNGGFFVAAAKFEDKETLKKNGFDWYADREAWCTYNPQVAARLRRHCDSGAKTQIDRSLIRVEPWSGRIPFPKGLTPKKYQLEAARFALSRNYSYLALEPGLGKTIVEALIINALLNIDCDTRIVIVNQPGLCANTQVEFEKWSCPCASLGYGVYDGQYQIYDTDRVLIVPDTKIDDPLGSHLELFRLVDAHTSLGNAWLFVDEAQRFNHGGSARTKALFKLAEKFTHVVFLSGTPMRKRPIELYPILNRFAGETINFMSENQYGHTYCAGKFDSFGRPDYSGASNTEYLFGRIKEKFMLRVRKKDVLPELPEKTTEIVFLADGATPAEVTTYERQHLRALSPRDCTRSKITKSPALATYRRLLGRLKAKPAASFIRDVLSTGDEAVLVFAEHKEVVSMIASLLASYSPVVVTGDDSAEKKQAKTQAFQKGKGRLFIGNTQACGLGFTLTKATRVIHVEPSWVPTDNDQASDRAHRIGQTEPVFEQYLCFRNSLDRAVLESAMKAREVLAQL